MTIEIFKSNLEQYLEELFNSKVRIEHLGTISEDISDTDEEDIKEFHYGKSFLLKVKLAGEIREYILATMTKNKFGHQFFYDRAKELLMDYTCFNKLPNHVKAVDIGTYGISNDFKSIGDVKEFFILREKVDGTEYIHDLERIKRENFVKPLDYQRMEALVDYLVVIHQEKKEEPSLYERRIRELLGHGECIMGLTDSYPKDANFTSQTELKKIEKHCIDWRYKIKDHQSRLSQVHGDFHPWNILFREGVDFSVLDRSRGEWGEPADDITSITINYLFLALQEHGEVKGVFFELFKKFWKRYLDQTSDDEILQLTAPFFAWRGLVIASPLWYPHIETKIRRKIFNFIHNILKSEKLIIKNVPDMFEKVEK